MLRSSAATIRRDLLRVAVGGRDVGNPVGLGQPVLAVVAVGDRDAEKGFLGLDPVVALGAQRVQPDAAGLLEIAGQNSRAASRKGATSSQSILASAELLEDRVQDLLLHDVVEVGGGEG